MIVEAASGAGLSLCYTQLVRDILPSLEQDSDVVVLVTGGSDISLAQLDEYKKKYFRPPVIVKSGSEVFLKMDDKLTHVVQSLDVSDPLGISNDQLSKLNQKPQKLKENSSQQKATMIDTPMEELLQSTQEEDDDHFSALTPTPANIKTPITQL
jgi:L-serine/L-threonine ammonia-lyase